jgi:uncharacterized delta-60 repeat protein
MKRKLLFGAVLSLLSTSYAQTVSFDPTFNNNAMVNLDQLNNYQKILVIDNENYYVNARVNQMDMFFEPTIKKIANNIAGNAAVSTYLDDPGIEIFSDIDKDANGNVYALGFSGENWNRNMHLLKLTSANTLDPTFNGGVEFFFNDPIYNHEPHIVRALSDGKIIVAGRRNNLNFFIMRLNANGTFDNTFGTSGIQIFDAYTSNTDPTFTDMIVLPNGKMLVSGYQYSSEDGASRGFVGRLNADGTKDLSFGTNGFTKLAFGEPSLSSSVNDIVVTSTGEIVAAGFGRAFEGIGNRSVGCVAKLDENGAIVSSFGNQSGVYNADILFNELFSGFNAVQILSDGTIVVAGGRGDGDNYNEGIMVFFNSNGVVNTSYANSGIHTITTALFTTLKDLKLQADGKLVFYLVGDNIFQLENKIGRVIIQSNNLVVSSPSLNAFSQTLGNPSSEQSFTVSGTNLTNDITITAPTNYEVSLTSGFGFASSVLVTQTSGTVPTTTIYVRLNAGAVGAHNGDITLTSGALNETVAVTGNTTDGTSGLSENNLTQLSIFPNPGSGVITLAINQPTSAVFTSTNGTVLANLELNSETNLDVSSYAPGVYFIRTAEGQTLKFIKE